jgi:hypothetical protein
MEMAIIYESLLRTTRGTVEAVSVNVLTIQTSVMTMEI